MAKEKVINCSGSRKRAIARATVMKGNGEVRINSIPLNMHQPEIARMKIQEALILSDKIKDTVNISVKVHGGGIMGQAEAARLAIATGILQFSKDKNLKEIYDNYDRHLLVADTRRKETCKPNYSKARKKRQKSYR